MRRDIEGDLRKCWCIKRTIKKGYYERMVGINSTGGQDWNYEGSANRRFGMIDFKKQCSTRQKTILNSFYSKLFMGHTFNYNKYVHFYRFGFNSTFIKILF